MGKCPVFIPGLECLQSREVLYVHEIECRMYRDEVNCFARTWESGSFPEVTISGCSHGSFHVHPSFKML